MITTLSMLILLQKLNEACRLNLLILTVNSN